MPRINAPTGLVSRPLRGLNPHVPFMDPVTNEVTTRERGLEYGDIGELDDLEVVATNVPDAIIPLITWDAPVGIYLCSSRDMQPVALVWRHLPDGSGGSSKMLVALTGIVGVLFAPSLNHRIDVLVPFRDFDDVLFRVLGGIFEPLQIRIIDYWLREEVNLHVSTLAAPEWFAQMNRINDFVRVHGPMPR